MEFDPTLFKNIRRIQIKATKHVQDVLAGAYQSAFKGRGMEFEDVREYQPGDEVRSIDWNVTARMQYPYVKNYREERELTVLLMVDVSASSLFGTQGKQKKDFIAEIAAVLAMSAINNNDKVGILLFSDHVEKFIPPQKGLKHTLRLIRELLVFKPKSKKTNLKEALIYFSKIYKRRGVLFVISDFMCESFKDELMLTSKRHEVIGINIRDPFEKSLPRIGLIELKDLETNKSMVVDTTNKKVLKFLEEKNQTEISEIKKNFESLGNGFINLCLSKPYIAPLIEYFNKKKQKS